MDKNPGSGMATVCVAAGQQNVSSPPAGRQSSRLRVVRNGRLRNQPRNQRVHHGAPHLGVFQILNLTDHRGDDGLRLGQSFVGFAKRLRDIQLRLLLGALQVPVLLAQHVQSVSKKALDLVVILNLALQHFTGALVRLCSLPLDLVALVATKRHACG